MGVITINTQAQDDETIPCGNEATYDGNEAYPSEQIIQLGTGVGEVILTYDAFSVPDKFTVEFDNSIVIDTGYRGDASYQSQLDARLANLGQSPEAIEGQGAGTASFMKNSNVSTAIVRVYAPMPGTAWSFVLSCPI